MRPSAPLTVFLTLALASFAHALTAPPLAHRAQHASLARVLTPAERRAFEAPQSVSERAVPAGGEKKKKRSSLTKRAGGKGKRKRCAPKSKSASSDPASTTTDTTATTSTADGQGAGNVAAAPTSQDSTPTTQAAPTSDAVPTTTSTTSTPAPPPTTTSTTTTAAAADPTTSSSSGSASDPEGILTGPHTGQGTYYAVGLGACGLTSTPDQAVVAVSELLFDKYPGYTGSNPNNNPVCGRQLTATYQGVSQTVTVVDRCVACAIWDLDMSTSVFDGFATASVGRISGVEWNWV